jgi:hypothetical protein
LQVCPPQAAPLEHKFSELQRYFTAAAEAASEVLQQAPEDSVLEGTEDLTRIAEAGIKPLDSPRCESFPLQMHRKKSS